jgi:uncharacterized membrane protein YjfL (UPF0719 family)
MTEFPLLNAVLFAALGLVVFTVALGALAKMAPFDVRKAIAEDGNVAAAILAGAAILGMAWIIAATMH